MKKVSIIVPCYNEEEMLPLFYDAIEPIMSDEHYEWQLLMINDGSADATLDVLKSLHSKDSRVDYIDLSRNFGKEAAMLAGLDNVSGDCAIIMDADLQHPVEVIPEMIEKWEEGYDDVYAQRITRGKESWLRKRISLRYYQFLQSSTDENVYPNVGDFRLLDRKCIEALRQLRESGRYTKGLYGYIGFRKTFVEFEQQGRAAGESKWSVRSLIGLGIEGFLSYSILPLRVATILGVLVSLLAFTYMIYVLIKALIFGDPVQGYPTLMTVILFLGGVQLLSLGIIGEYLGRTFKETKQRPVYFIREKTM